MNIRDYFFTHLSYILMYLFAMMKFLMFLLRVCPTDRATLYKLHMEKNMYISIQIYKYTISIQSFCCYIHEIKEVICERDDL